MVFHSGFEDDFSVSEFKVCSGTTSRSTTFSADPFDCFDEFSSGKMPPPATVFQPPSNIRNLKPAILPKPLTVGNASFFTSTNAAAAVPSSLSSNFDETLCNGKSLIVKPTISMPTIIKPVSAKGKAPSPTHIELKKTETIREIPSGDSFECDNDEEEDSCSSPPMPSFAPPPLPSNALTLAMNEDEREPYAIALYDFETEVAEDLNFKVSHWNIRITHKLKLIAYIYICRPMRKSIWLSKWTMNGSTDATSVAVMAFFR